MTATEFRQTHGDPATWTTADMETYEHLAEIDTLPPAVHAWHRMADELNAQAARIRAQRAAAA
jgi:hypothetical protein